MNYFLLRTASEESNLKRRKRKRQKRKGVRGKEVGEESSSTFGLQTVELEEPLSIPQTLLGEYRKPEVIWSLVCIEWISEKAVTLYNGFLCIFYYFVS